MERHAILRLQIKVGQNAVNAGFSIRSRAPRLFERADRFGAKPMERHQLLGHLVQTLSRRDPELNQLNQIENVVVLGVNFDGKVGEALVSDADDLGIAFDIIDDPALT